VRVAARASACASATLSIETYVREQGVRDVRGRVYGHDARARNTLHSLGLGVDDVHLRKDLLHPK